MSSYALATMKTDSYLQTQREARKIRDDYRYKVDPILQRNSKNEKPRQHKETINYFIQLQNGEEKASKRMFPHKTSNFFSENTLQTESEIKASRKKYLATEYEQRLHSDKPHMIKMIKCKASDSHMNTIFNDDKAPIEKERVNVKLTANNGEPSSEYKRMNERINNLPHSMGNRSEKNTKSVDHLKGGQIINHNEQKIRMRNSVQKKNSIEDLINQDNAPCLGYDCSVKPTTITFDTLKKGLVMNRMNKKKLIE